MHNRYQTDFCLKNQQLPALFYGWSLKAGLLFEQNDPVGPSQALEKKKNSDDTTIYTH